MLLKPPETALTSRWNFTDEMFEIANRMMNSASSSVIMSAYVSSQRIMPALSIGSRACLRFMRERRSPVTATR